MPARLEVNITVTRKEEEPPLKEEEEAAKDHEADDNDDKGQENGDDVNNSNSNDQGTDNDNGGNDDNNDDDEIEYDDLEKKKKNDNEDDLYQMKVESGGKYIEKVNWDVLSKFCKQELDSPKIADMIENYQRQNFPEKLKDENHKPHKCWLKDEPPNYTIFKDYKWNPVKIKLEPADVDIRDKFSKPVILEEITWDYTKDLNVTLKEKGDVEVTSILKKSKLKGHPLALSMVKCDSLLTTKFRGIDGTTFATFGLDDTGVKDEESGTRTWTDTKTLGAILKDKPLPKKSGKGVSRQVQIVGYENYIRARVYYKAKLTGEVSTDHGHGRFEGQRYWNFPIKYILQYNDIPNAALIYEDIVLHFFTDIKFAMENTDFEWVMKDGKWQKSYNDSLETNSLDGSTASVH